MLRARRAALPIAGLVSLLAGAVLVVAPASAAASSTYAVFELPIGGLPNSMAVDPATDTVYAGIDNNDAVAVIDGASNAETALIKLPNIPNTVAVDPASDTVYAICGQNSGAGVDVIDGATNAITTKISLPSTLVAIAAAVNPVTHMLYIADYYDGTVIVINGVTDTVAATIPLADPVLDPTPRARGIAVDTTTNTVYVADLNGNQVEVIDGIKNTVTGRIALPASSKPYGVAADPAAGLVYVAEQGTGSISVIDTATDGVSTLASGITQPEGLALDAGTGTLYTTSAGGSVTPAGALSTTYPIDTASGVIEAQIPRGGTSAAVLASGGPVYVDGSNIVGNLGADVTVITPSTVNTMSPVIAGFSGNTNLTVGQPAQGQLVVSATPSATLTVTGLPAWLTIGPSGLLSGTPPAGTAGTIYTLTVTAANGVQPSATRIFSLVVEQPPVITSGDHAAFAAGVAGSFAATATGWPGPVFTETGALPTGVTFNSAGVLSGIPATGTAGSYPIQITATNDLGTATQAFTLAVTLTSYSTVAVMPVDAGGATSGGFAVWAVDASGTLWNGWQTSPGSAWKWAAMGNGFRGTPAVEPVDAGGGSSGGFTVWVVDTSGNLWNGWQTSLGSAWKWANLGGGNLNTPAVTVEPVDAGGGSSGGFALWLVDGRGRLMNGWQTSAGSGWHWASVATGFQGTPAVEPVNAGGGSSGGFAAWAVDTAGNLWNGWQTSSGSAWKWANMGGGNTGTQAVTVEPADAGGATSGGFAIWLVDASGRLMNGVQTSSGSAWTWASLGSNFTHWTPAVEPVDAGGSASGGFAVWAVDTTGTLWNGLQTSPGSGWTFASLDSGKQGIVVAEPVDAGGATTGGFTVWAIGTSGVLWDGLQTSSGSAWTWTSIGV